MRAKKAPGRCAIKPRPARGSGPPLGASRGEPQRAWGLHNDVTCCLPLLTSGRSTTRPGPINGRRPLGVFFFCPGGEPTQGRDMRVTARRRRAVTSRRGGRGGRSEFSSQLGRTAKRSPPRWCATWVRCGGCVPCAATIPHAWVWMGIDRSTPLTNSLTSRGKTSVPASGSSPALPARLWRKALIPGGRVHFPRPAIHPQKEMRKSS
jgi:hypothetical protein